MFVINSDIPDKTVLSHSMTINGHNIIVFGGTGVPFGQETSNSIYLLNTHTLIWKKLDLKGDVPFGVYGCVCIILLL